MKSAILTINSGDGLHTRPASVFVREAGKFQSEVTLSSEGTSVNGKSIMGILMLALGPGASVELVVNGPDEDQALEKLRAVLSGEET